MTKTILNVNGQQFEVRKTYGGFVGAPDVMSGKYRVRAWYVRPVGSDSWQLVGRVKDDLHRWKANKEGMTEENLLTNMAKREAAIRFDYRDPAIESFARQDDITGLASLIQRNISTPQLRRLIDELEGLYEPLEDPAVNELEREFEAPGNDEV